MSLPDPEICIRTTFTCQGDVNPVCHSRNFSNNIPDKFSIHQEGRPVERILGYSIFPVSFRSPKLTSVSEFLKLIVYSAYCSNGGAENLDVLEIEITSSTLHPFAGRCSLITAQYGSFWRTFLPSNSSIDSTNRCNFSAHNVVRGCSAPERSATILIKASNAGKIIILNTHVVVKDRCGRAFRVSIIAFPTREPEKPPRHECHQNPEIYNRTIFMLNSGDFSCTFPCLSTRFSGYFVQKATGTRDSAVGAGAAR